MLPSHGICVEPQVGIPYYAGPVDFQPLDFEFGEGVFQSIGGSDVIVIVQKPVDEVRLVSDVDTYGFQSFAFAACQNAVAFAAACFLLEPFLGCVE